MNFLMDVVLSAKPEAIWPIFFDVGRIAGLIPGCEQVEEKEPLALYAAVMKQKIGPFKLEVPTEIRVEAMQAQVRVCARAKGRDKFTGTHLDVLLEVVLERLDASVDPICASVDPICASVDPICARVDPICARVDPSCAGVDPSCAGVDPSCAGVGPNYAGVDPIFVGVDPTRTRVGDGGTRLTVASTMQVAGRLASLGYPVVKKKAEEIFVEFERRLRAELGIA